MMEKFNCADGIIYYGGSFNPPHIAHVMMISMLHAYFPKTRILAAPTYSHAFGKALMDYNLRLEMLRECIGCIPQVEISEIERELHQDTSYTIDVVRALHHRMPEKRIFIAVGADILPQLPMWRSYDELCRLSEFLIFPREGYDNSRALPIPHLPEVSSSEIRAMLNEPSSEETREKLRARVPACVLERIGGI